MYFKNTAQVRCLGQTLLVSAVDSLNRAGHILTTTHWGFHHAMSVRAFGDMNSRSVIGRDGAMYKFLAALAAGHGANAHTTFFTGIDCHLSSPG